LIVVGISAIKTVRGVKLSTLLSSLYAHRIGGRRWRETLNQPHSTLFLQLRQQRKHTILF
jgi:hypothetical protein